MLFIFFTKLVLALLSLFVLGLSMFGILRVFDWLLGTRFKDVMSVIQRSPEATAIYFGLRWLGMCFAVGVLVCLCVII